LRREIAHLLQLLHEGFHLLPRVLGLKVHRLVDVLALGELQRDSEIRLGILAGDLGDLGVQRRETDPRRLRRGLERLLRFLARRGETIEGPLCLLDAHLHEIAHRLRNLRLHECVIRHATLLCAYLPFVVCLVLPQRLEAPVPLHGLVHG
jgi:hypothetical protein